MLKRIVGIVAAALLVSGTQAHAEVGYFKVDFTASSFTSVSPGWPGPAPVVNGSYTYSLDDIKSPYRPVLLGVDLSIAGHKYTVADTQLIFSKSDIFFGTNPFAYPAEGTYDFTLTNNSFEFASGAAGVWSAQNVSLSYTLLSGPPSLPSAVPEADTYAMLLAGMGLMGVIARRRRQA